MGGCAYGSEADDASCAAAAFVAAPAVGPSVRAMLLGVAPISVLSVRGGVIGSVTANALLGISRRYFSRC